MSDRPEVTPEITPAPIVLPAPNPAQRIRFAYEGGDLGPLIAEAHASMADGRYDPGVLLDLGVLYQLAGQPEDAQTCQHAALRRQRLFRHSPLGPLGAPAEPAAQPLRLLALVCAGDLMTNTPLDLMLEGCAVEVTKLYVSAGEPPPAALPDHDLALVAIGESDATGALLDQLSGLEAVWPRPMMNAAARIRALSRERLWPALQGAPGLVCPPTLRVSRERLVSMLSRGEGPAAILGQGDWPIIVRPVGSHAGRSLEKIDGPAALVAYLTDQAAPELYVSPFVDYAGADGRFRKLRIAFFDGTPHLCHLAVGDHWMVHYLNADMNADAGKRAEEQAAMQGFGAFAARHAGAFAALHERLGLDYFAVDCAETADGRILVFEADVAMIVHDLDPPDLYPYKKPQMRKVFDAFEALLRKKAATAR
jgi:hypothetical protein